MTHPRAPSADQEGPVNQIEFGDCRETMRR